MFCKYCGYELEDDSLFCSRCGKTLGKEISTQEVIPSIEKDKTPPKQKKNLGKKIAIAIIVIVSVRTVGRIAYTKASTPKENKITVENNSLSLVQAVKSNSIDEVKRLINNGADVNGIEKIGDYTYTPLQLAAINDFADIAELLIDSGAEINLRQTYTALDYAAGRNSIHVARLLIDRGADIETVDSEGRTPILQAAMGNSIDVIRLLIDRGANIEATDSLYHTALMYAARHNAIDVAKLLIEHGANIESKSPYNFTALMGAACDNAIDGAKLLIENGADINAKTSDGKTVLMHAVSSVDVAKLLINRGTKDNLTHVLFETAWESSADVVKLFLDNGANVNAHNANGYTVLMKVAAGNSIDVAKVLLNRGAKVTATDNNGNTALHEAVNYGRPNMSRLLIESGANLYAKNKDGKTALMLIEKEPVKEVSVKETNSGNKKYTGFELKAPKVDAKIFSTLFMPNAEPEDKEAVEKILRQYMQ